jgi:hypothetical protein
MCSVVIELIHLDCRAEKHAEQETDEQNEKKIEKFLLK